MSGQKYAGGVLAVPSVFHPTISSSALYQLCVYTADTSSVNFQSVNQPRADISRFVSNLISTIFQTWCAASGMNHRGPQKLCRIWVGLGDPPPCRC